MMVMMMMKTKMCQDVIRISVRLKPDMNLIARKHRRVSVIEGRAAGLLHFASFAAMRSTEY